MTFFSKFLPKKSQKKVNRGDPMTFFADTFFWPELGGTKAGPGPKAKCTRIIKKS